jgi:hypothetical protein
MNVVVKHCTKLCLAVSVLARPGNLESGLLTQDCGSGTRQWPVDWGAEYHYFLGPFNYSMQ